MVTRSKQARQERRANSHRLNLPQNFPSPKFHFGDLVRTNEGDDGEVVGMILLRSQDRVWWTYKLDLCMDSPNFWKKQGNLLCSSLEEEISPCPEYYEEFQLTEL
ncbi:MAG: hypothetical protein F6K48_28150 [Okeania sp. SIO3H1]|uniref:hypothetical protein n=1 Tax=Okeania sp. SIO1I7 TaxID=2607772 RepID=UPI0013C8E790|nr:hypothetical protein [Okeania sp. SIO1I7]NEN92560.1 hypothetical protein [Okeania sp. SIO3H1]NET30328.1 hypothetical protein [Okeania sp. SIO1I7]